MRCRTAAWWERVPTLAKGHHPQQREASAFDAVGGGLTIPESQLDAVTAVFRSKGPAYFFLRSRALVDAGVGVGLSRQVATDLARAEQWLAQRRCCWSGWARPRVAPMAS